MNHFCSILSKYSGDPNTSTYLNIRNVSICQMIWNSTTIWIPEAEPFKYWTNKSNIRYLDSYSTLFVFLCRLSPNPTTSVNNLTLEQKQKMIKDSENLQRMQNQGPPLATGSNPSPYMSTSTNKSNQMKDLTDSLMQANLNRYNQRRFKYLTPVRPVFEWSLWCESWSSKSRNMYFFTVIWIPD